MKNTLKVGQKIPVVTALTNGIYKIGIFEIGKCYVGINITSNLIKCFSPKTGKCIVMWLKGRYPEVKQVATFVVKKVK